MNVKQIDLNTKMQVENCYDFEFEQQHLQDEFNFLIATKIVRNLKNKGLISAEEFNLIMLENKHTFPTFVASIIWEYELWRK